MYHFICYPVSVRLCLLKNMSMVFQNVYLFHDTIENNIKFGCPDATHDQVVEAAKKACCHDFISTLPQGYDAVIGEGGSTLSGGEKQRISIARAMLKDAPIILLDEATASVDPENEVHLQQAISALVKNKTLIVIAHRLSTIRDADQILVVDNGKIAFRPAVELSYLSKEQQQTLCETMECEDCTPSLAQAIKMKEFSRDGKLTDEVILSIMQEEKPNQKEQFKMPKERISKYFAPGTPAQKIEDTIIKALELYRRRERQRDMER